MNCAGSSATTVFDDLVAALHSHNPAVRLVEVGGGHMYVMKTNAHR